MYKRNLHSLWDCFNLLHVLGACQVHRQCPLTFAVWKFQNLPGNFQKVCVLLFAHAWAKEGKKWDCHKSGSQNYDSDSQKYWH